MITYKEGKLNNGLTFIVHEDKTASNLAFNLIYDVGAKDEQESLTGFAHLFEHLMFEGSENIKSFDEPLQKVGGTSNAFTSNDVTNYYITLPVENIETAFWLESDRMNQLAFSQKSLDVQKKVVIEEYRQRYLNQPYGDIWLILRPLLFEKHPYKWPTIGKEIQHIEKATLDEVKDFFYTHYCPSRAKLVVSGNISFEKVSDLTIKWFGDIEKRSLYSRNLPEEKMNKGFKEINVKRNVPQNAIYIAFHIPERYSKEYYRCDLISDILGRGKSSRLYNLLIKGKELCSEVACFVTGELDPGLLVFTAKLNDGVEFDTVKQIFFEEVDNLKHSLGKEELEKVKNKFVTTKMFSERSVLNKALGLAYGAIKGNPNLVNEEVDDYKKITIEEVNQVLEKYIVKENCAVLNYQKEV